MLTGGEGRAHEPQEQWLGVHVLREIHAVPPATAPDGSLGAWLWLIVGLALVLAGGLVLASRR